MILPRLKSEPFASVFEAVESGKKKIKLSGLRGSSLSFLLSLLVKKGQIFCLVAPSYTYAERLFQELLFFLQDEIQDKNEVFSAEPLFFPPWDILPYEPSNPRPDWIARRLSALYQMTHGKGNAVVTTVDAFLQRVISKPTLLERYLKLTVGTTHTRDTLVEKLCRMGYEAGGTTVRDPGEIALRGGILDLYSPLSDAPVRIEFFGDDIESIRTFDPETQRSIRQIDAVEIIPGRENILERKFHKMSLSDYLPLEALLIFVEPDEVVQNGRRLLEEAEEGAPFAQKRDPRYPHAKDLFLPLSHLFDAGEGRTRIDIEALLQCPEKEVIRLDLDIRKASSLGFGRTGQPFSETCEVLASLRVDYLMILIVKNQQQIERFGRLLADHDIPWSLWDKRLLRKADEASGQIKTVSLPAPIFLTIGPIVEGFLLPQAKLLVISDEELMGVGKRSTHVRTQKKAKKPGKAGQTSGFLVSFEDLKSSDYVIHFEHGVGQYLGLKRIPVRRTERGECFESDFMILKYAGGDKIYVPLDSLNLIQRYVGLEGRAPKLDKLGSSRWSKTKARVKKEIQEMTQELLELYAQREVLEGHAFATPLSYAEEFAAAFEFEETPDQLRSIQEVLADMESNKPMDRLVCGDVGYGKTEVAMRAAFHAVMDNKQVAMVVPTTLLAHQHYKSFTSRFAPFPVRVAVISRFLSRSEQREVIASLKDGKVDILIGTHRLLQKDVQFREIGLIVVDEEHRFGVRHKEWLTQIRKEVDVLTLTATPIPRTLQMSLAQVRDLSVIETPPADRLAIQTIMTHFDPTIIREAVFRELVRGGQVFFLHNRVNNIEQIGTFLKELIPEAKIGIAHGQMRETALENVMLKFLKKEYNLLLTTTIIESGIDIPSANTIIINNAERFGLAELYQLRGRVGRSGDQAYAYLLVQEGRILSTEARQRLEAIQEFTELGAGFRVAARDLEIRGAGNLLGSAQSGQIAAVGFELYLEMINELVQELKGKPVEKMVEPVLHFQVSAFLPEEYIADSYQRLSIYKRLSSRSEHSDIEAMRSDLEDRYGPLPEAVTHLLEIIQLKHLASTAKIVKLEEKRDAVQFFFDEGVSLPETTLARLLEQFGKKIRFISAWSFSLSVRSRAWTDIYLDTAHCLEVLQKES